MWEGIRMQLSIFCLNVEIYMCYKKLLKSVWSLWKFENLVLLQFQSKHFKIIID